MNIPSNMCIFTTILYEFNYGRLQTIISTKFPKEVDKKLTVKAVEIMNSSWKRLKKFNETESIKPVSIVDLVSLLLCHS